MSQFEQLIKELSQLTGELKGIVRWITRVEKNGVANTEAISTLQLKIAEAKGVGRGVVLSAGLIGGIISSGITIGVALLVHFLGG